MAFAAPDFLASLRLFVDAYEGSRQRTVMRAPDVFEFYARLFCAPTLSRDARAMVNAVLAYFVVPEDVMPEADFGPLGLMDDLFVAAHVYRILRRELPTELLTAAWQGDGPLDETMDHIYTDARAEVGKRTKDALRMAGLSG
ncbi:MAG: DUF1232 domain-containing protein [Deltaproteobacteria bacterium]|nr:DUF1232 domain-containing protein [Deltaproteobacteria bacterium]MBK8234142.1 DUF1232 domain-containing protein [Deltaproteobacteria bacterium]MBP7287400.1 DUF1232 domain-containing protein [Nannocystaceae bacterium]